MCTVLYMYKNLYIYTHIYVYTHIYIFVSTYSVVNVYIIYYIYIYCESLEYICLISVNIKCNQALLLKEFYFLDIVVEYVGRQFPQLVHQSSFRPHIYIYTCQYT